MEKKSADDFAVNPPKRLFVDDTEKDNKSETGITIIAPPDFPESGTEAFDAWTQTLVKPKDRLKTSGMGSSPVSIGLCANEPSLGQQPRVTNSPSSVLQRGGSVSRASSSELELDADDCLTVGLCCMDIKLKAKPINAILARLQEYHNFHIEIFGNDTILNKPVEEWPIVKVLMCFSSAGFPLKKAEKYVELRKPFCINDVPMQEILLDRRKVYMKLEEAGIPTPRHVFANRPSDQDTDFCEVMRNSVPQEGEDSNDYALAEEEEIKGDLIDENDPLHETEDSITVNGVVIKKPFIEKPISSENHNICLYYPRSAGGGSKRLFRKVYDRSSRYCKNISKVRRNHSFVYEEFLSTDGADIKVYTVGPDYAHAEARKAPTVDGTVQRASDGKELRYPVILTPQEKEIARKIVQVFGQNICGFDLLRTDCGSYVCDVNGWSLAKFSNKYCCDCSQVCKCINRIIDQL